MEVYINHGDNQLRLDRSTRRLFAYVPQGNLLLSGSLRENLCIEKPAAMELCYWQLEIAEGKIKTVKIR